MQKNFEIEREVPEIWGFNSKGLEIILLHETKKEEKIPLWHGRGLKGVSKIKTEHRTFELCSLVGLLSWGTHLEMA